MAEYVVDKERIYIDYHPKVMAYINSRINNTYEAEDLAQNVFLKVYSKLDDFDSTKSSISTWIYNITKNTLIDYFRTRPRDLHEEIPEYIADTEDTPEEGCILEEQQQMLAAALSELSSVERDVIILRYYKNYNLTKISEMMALPYGQVKRIHAKALSKLNKELGENR